MELESYIKPELREHEIIWWVRGVGGALKAGQIALYQIKKRLGQRFSEAKFSVRSIIKTGNRHLVVIDVKTKLTAEELEQMLHIHVEDKDEMSSYFSEVKRTLKNYESVRENPAS